VGGTNAGMSALGDYILRLYSTDPSVFDFSALPAFD